jgi:hypothetical protein
MTDAPADRAAALDALIARHGPLRIAMLVMILRRYDPDRPADAATIAGRVGPSLAPLDAALVEEVAAALGLRLPPPGTTQPSAR